MKFLVVLSCLLAAASAGYVASPFVRSSFAPTFYNGFPYGYSYGYNQPYGYSYGYNTATPFSSGYSYTNVGATPYAAVAPAPVVAPVPGYAPAFYSAYDGAQTQYRSQDGLGNYAFGYAGGPSTRHEVRSADGVVQGSFSYIDGNNLVQSRSYVADASGFRVAGTDVPAAPAPVAVVAAGPAVIAHPGPAVVVKAADHAIIEGPGYTPVEGVDVPHKTPEVKQAEAEHLAAHRAALSRVKREALPEPRGKLVKAAKPWPKKASRNQYPIASVKVPAKGHRRWRREADPEPKGKKLWVPKKASGHGYRRAYAPKKLVHKKW